MKNLYKQKRAQGFTIIEVMIVLAIAAVILLIVLLAVPALQRNSRNTQRNNDVASIAAAINTCMANNNSVPASCSGTAASGNSVDVDFSKLGQITSASSDTAVNCAKNGTSATGAGLTNACWVFAQTCNGNALQGATSREFAIVFQTETSGGTTKALPRCVSS